MADKSACLLPIASFTIVCSVIDSSLGMESGVRTRALGRSGRLPRGKGVGRLSSYGDEGLAEDDLASTSGAEVDDDWAEARRWLYVMYMRSEASVLS